MTDTDMKTIEDMAPEESLSDDEKLKIPEFEQKKINTPKIKFTSEIICPIHGINNNWLKFDLDGKETYYCLRCLNKFLSKHIKPLEIIDE